jgi:hypothetical protein
MNLDRRYICYKCIEYDIAELLRQILLHRGRKRETIASSIFRGSNVVYVFCIALGSHS